MNRLLGGYTQNPDKYDQDPDAKFDFKIHSCNRATGSGIYFYVAFQVVNQSGSHSPLSMIPHIPNAVANNM